MSYLGFKKINPDDPDSLYRAVIGDEVHEGLTYQEVIELMVRADFR